MLVHAIVVDGIECVETADVPATAPTTVQVTDVPAR